MKKFMIVPFLLLNLTILSQEIYVVDGLHNRIFKLESNFSYSLVVNFTDQGANNYTGDIAIAPNGLMYGLARNGKIFTINLSDGTTQIISEFPATNQLNSYVSLTSGNDYNLYTLNYLGDLYRYNILTNTIHYIDDLNTTSPGDLSFYRGKLIFQSLNDQNIKAYDLTNNTIKNLLCTEALFCDGLLGLSNVFNDCNSDVFYATDCLNSLYELNMTDGTTQYIPAIFPPSAPDFWGMATTNEYLASDCSGEIQDNACNLTTSNFNRTNKILVYPTLFDNHLTINSVDPIKQVDVLDTSGRKIMGSVGNIQDYSLDNLSSGVYYLRIATNASVYIEKVIKK